MCRKGLNMYVVNILMSTYNGEQFIVEQIESIMRQVDVKTILTIRDDGSSDHTRTLITQMKSSYSGRIELICGENIGYRQSFLQLLKYAKEADYYGFADQDDVWIPEKCIRAIEILETMNHPVKLYASGVFITDEALNYIHKTNVENVELSLPSVFVRHRLAGCTYLFSAQLKSMASVFADIRYVPSEMPDYDFIVFSCALAFGQIYLDQESYIYHRRHHNSVTSGGNGIRKRIQMESRIIFKRKDIRYHLANEFLKKYKQEFKEEDYVFLSMVCSYKKSWLQKLKLFFYKELSCGLFLGNIEAKIKILLGNF